MKKCNPRILALMLCIPFLVIACGGGGGGGGDSSGDVSADYVSTDTPLAIPDGNDDPYIPGVVSSYLLVAGAPNPISKVTLTINITHTFTPDLWIYLESPTGTEVLVS